MRILCVQIDGGKLPNLALMRIMATHRARGDEVVFSRQTGRGLFDSGFDRVYGSVIFTTSAAKVARLRASWPHAIVGGSGVADRPDASAADKLQVDDVLPDAAGAEYGPWHDYAPSIGFTSRGCRMACKFCGVPGREGRPMPTSTISQIWRGPGHTKKLHLPESPMSWTDALIILMNVKYLSRILSRSVLRGRFEPAVAQSANC